MVLSRLMLNLRHKRTQSELARPYELHRTIMSAFPAELDGDRVLFRPEIDERSGALRVIVQSATQPDWSRLAAQPGYLQRPPESKTIALTLIEGQVLAFRLRANPTVKKATHDEKPVAHPGWLAARREQERQGIKPSGGNGIRLGIKDEKGQLEWLNRKGEQSGFRVLKVQVRPEGLQVSHKRDSASTKHVGHRMAHLAVTFDGLLQVTDPERLRAAVAGGIGSAKALGFGLLSLAPPPQGEND